MSDEIRIERTGNIFSLAASEYLITFPDGSTQTLWSPPWHELDDLEEDAAAHAEARKLWQAKQEVA